MSKIEGSARAHASPSEVYFAGKLQWHFTGGFDFRHSLGLPCAAVLSVSKGIVFTFHSLRYKRNFLCFLKTCTGKNKSRKRY